MPMHFFPLTRKHYHLHYRGKYVHAKKLFAFDLALLFGVVVLIFFTAYIMLYDPTIKSEISLTIDTPINRFRSGDSVPVIVTYKNNSSIRLKDVRLEINLPPNFISDNSSADGKKTIFIDHIEPAESGGVTLNGKIYGKPESTITTIASLYYRQEHKNNFEEKIGVGIFSPHGSILETKLDISTTTIALTDIPFTLTISNNGQNSSPEIRVAIPKNANSYTDNTKTDRGSVNETYWHLSDLPAQTTANLYGLIHFENTSQIPRSTNIIFTPELILPGQNLVAQNSAEAKIQIYPNPIKITNGWDNTRFAKAGTSAPLNLQIENTTNVTIKNLQLKLPLPQSIIDSTKLLNLNGGTIHQGIYTKNLTDLKAGEQTNIVIKIPIMDQPTGSADIALNLTPRISGFMSQNNIQFNSRSTVAPLPIGTVLSLRSDLRYYTDEGDQIGRGPLPPKVGSETKYWAIITLQNSTSEISDVTLNATLSPGIRWVGQTNVTLGNDVKYNPDNRQITWQIKHMDPFDNAQISVELGFTPNIVDTGTSHPVLANIIATAHDEFIDLDLTTSAKSIDTSLPTDSYAQKRGVLAIE